MRLAVFDLDGTLVDSLPDLADSVNILLQDYGLSELDVGAVRSMIGDGVAVLVERALSRSGPGAATIDRQKATKRFMEIYGPRATERSRLFPGAKATLIRMRDQGWHLAVCTNKPVSAARSILEGYGLMDLLSAVGGGDSFATRKPDSGHLLGTIRLADGDAADSVMIGDHANDIRTATGAGACSIFAAWGYGIPACADGATATATTIDEVPEIAARLLPGAC
ncbi:HAD hydrolase-like protein [Acetobacter oeni]|uniref:phosphoglycolate phosphatase n=1 Tax=Acetobacter oeni TaxID=304077 RepID=A0A511XHF9_9PROT|nr:HAD hydrolase-like protein [Acetobacter oeni]MBB3881226.1 phosphoglycolate phosphatase [Acetobacter oeni]NHO18101.1 HAD hydrolase-like protein [Acetobacter oeni]GBR08301.1 phosphoglycolate phosphatase [Acetobacter oeni LMG 21952]GEN62377.1 phosphoglycolate phosphatase, bacterial [Acetobacter oeni]